jgi:hypothetical protein
VLLIALLKPWFQDASFEYHNPNFPDHFILTFRGVPDFFREFVVGLNDGYQKKKIIWSIYGPKQLFLLQEISSLKNVDFTPLY